MVATRQMQRLIEHARQQGAKVVLVGDHMQLQPIEAGAAFRAIVERTGAVYLHHGLPQFRCN
jgi:ATP-dependent exoDNAse (exonuclease V) alpha subunit